MHINRYSGMDLCLDSRGRVCHGLKAETWSLDRIYNYQLILLHPIYKFTSIYISLILKHSSTQACGSSCSVIVLQFSPCSFSIRGVPGSMSLLMTRCKCLERALTVRRLIPLIVVSLIFLIGGITVVARLLLQHFAFLKGGLTLKPLRVSKNTDLSILDLE